MKHGLFGSRRGFLSNEMRVFEMRYQGLGVSLSASVLIRVHPWLRNVNSSVAACVKS
jgi:hypothetical protein